MTPSSAPPSPGCANSTLLLQRKLSNCGDERWRTLLRARPDQMPLVDELVALVGRIDPSVRWRMAGEDGAVLVEQQ